MYYRDSSVRRSRRLCSFVLSSITTLSLLGLAGCGGSSGSSGFTSSTFVSGLSEPTAMAFAPDGRLFVSEKNGTVRVVKNGGTLPTPFVTIPVDSTNDHGLIGIALDPDFATNGYVYVQYTATTSTLR